MFLFIFFAFIFLCVFVEVLSFAVKTFFFFWNACFPRKKVDIKRVMDKLWLD